MEAVPEKSRDEHSEGTEQRNRAGPEAERDENTARELRQRRGLCERCGERKPESRDGVDEKRAFAGEHELDLAPAVIHGEGDAGKTQQQQR